MNGMQIFNYQDKQVRTVEKDGEPWWVLKDVCEVLEMGSPHKVAERLEEDERNQIPVTDSIGRQQETTIINESGLYNVILRSDKPQAKPFRKWVTSEVLPALRKTGSYSLKPMTDYQQMMAETRRRNARVQSARILTQLAKQYHGTTYEQILNAHATKELTGEYLLPLPKLEQKTFSAEEIGQKIGISAHKVGQLANKAGLKNDKYGQWFKDKARSSEKEVSCFRYYETVIPVLRGIIEEETCFPSSGH